MVECLDGDDGVDTQDTKHCEVRYSKLVPEIETYFTWLAVAGHSFLLQLGTIQCNCHNKGESVISMKLFKHSIH